MALADVDDAIFVAFKAAKAAGEVERACSLLELLRPRNGLEEAASIATLALARDRN